MLFCLTLTGAADVAASTGAVVGWGSDDNGQATPPDAVNGVSGTATAIAAGHEHSCAIQAASGNVVCWGDDWAGQAMPPDAVNGVSGTATDITVSWQHSCAIQAGTGFLFGARSLLPNHRRQDFPTDIVDEHAVEQNIEE
jgi:hypothetical protein